MKNTKTWLTLLLTGLLMLGTLTACGSNEEEKRKDNDKAEQTRKEAVAVETDDSGNEEMGSEGLSAAYVSHPGNDGNRIEEGTCRVSVGHCTDTEIVIPPTLSGKVVTAIALNGFMNCENITSVQIPDTVTWIGAGAFEGCTSLTHITIPASVTDISFGAFEGCTSLTSVVFENPDGWIVSYISPDIDGESIDLSDPAQAAIYLTDTYVDYSFDRN